MESGEVEFASLKKKKMVEMKKKMKNLTKEQLKAAVEKKKICNAKAMTIVERLIEPNVEQAWLLDNLFYINQSHYQDAVEERAIIKSCGYPLCDVILDEIPKKQYHISTKQNKVFDITDRKNYCSNLCYKASVYLKDQLYTSPLWLRDCEDLVQYKLLSLVNKTGSTGVEIDLGNVSPVKTDGTNSEKEKAKSVDSVENSPISAIISQCDVYSLNSENCKSSEVHEPVDNECDIQSETIHVGEYIKESEVEAVRQNSEKKKQLNRRKIRKSTRNIYDAGEKISVFLDSWLTEYSLRFLYGDDKVKEIFKEFGTPYERFGNLINTKDAYMYERYTELCKRLNFLELKEKVSEREEVMPTKPLPDYEVLRKEAKCLEIKVRSFYRGGKKVSFQNDEPDENKGNEPCENKNENENCTLPVLPLIEKHSVLATRRRIVLEKLFKTLLDIQSALGLAHINVRHEMLEFVHTLALTASNITLSPSEWNLMAMVIIKLFTIRNELLERSFRTDLTQKRIINLLLSYGLGLDYLQSCVLKLTNLEQIIKNST